MSGHSGGDALINNDVPGKKRHGGKAELFVQHLEHFGGMSFQDGKQAPLGRYVGVGSPWPRKGNVDPKKGRGHVKRTGYRKELGRRREVVG